MFIAFHTQYLLIFIEKGYKNIVSYSDAITTDKVRNKVDQLRHCSLKQWKCGKFDILNHMSEYVMLVQLIENLVNFIFSVSISGVWVYDVNYKKHFLL